MGKKCVQLVKQFSTTLCTSGFYTLLRFASSTKVGTSTTNPQYFQKVIHNHIRPRLQQYVAWFYTESTEPIITIIYIYNKKPIRVG